MVGRVKPPIPLVQLWGCRSLSRGPGLFAFGRLCGCNGDVVVVVGNPSGTSTVTLVCRAAGALVLSAWGHYLSIPRGNS